MRERRLFFFQFRNHKIGQFYFVYFSLQGLDTTITTGTMLDLIYCILKEQYTCISFGKLFILLKDKYALVFWIKKSSYGEENQPLADWIEYVWYLILLNII